MVQLLWNMFSMELIRNYVQGFVKSLRKFGWLVDGFVTLRYNNNKHGDFPTHGEIELPAGGAI